MVFFFVIYLPFGLSTNKYVLYHQPLGFGLTFCSQAHFYEYHYVNRPMTWTEAQRYCREKHTDLVTIESAEDMSKLKRSNSHTGLSWIGLTDDPKSWKGVMGNDVNSWRWSATGETAKTDYQNWAPNEPNYGQVRETCGFIDDNGLWLDGGCSDRFHFFCFNGKNKIVFTYLKITRLKSSI
uniref:C-type lectin domain-containing protein n=1 Tax=Seriola lalandi dorsalis TaxID=1841481 RepID=A0A3B4XX63_SERLL